VYQVHEILVVQKEIKVKIVRIKDEKLALELEKACEFRQLSTLGTKN
jgi:predicted RNA-binding protein with RPS1 domain